MDQNAKDGQSEKKFPVVIIDDDPNAISRLRNMLEPYDILSVTATANNAVDGIKTIEQTSPALVFIDVDLPEDNGFDVVTHLRTLPQSENLYIIMYTAYYDDCSKRGQVFVDGEQDYLLKPIDPKELDITIQRFLYSRRTRTSQGSLQSFAMPPEDNKVLVVLTTTSEMRMIRIKDIGYFRYNSKRKMWEVALADKTVVQLKKTSTAGDILGYSQKFVQTHQSYIVNIDYVMLIGKQRINLYPPFENDEALVGRTYLKALQAKFMCI